MCQNIHNEGSYECAWFGRVVVSSWCSLKAKEVMNTAKVFYGKCVVLRSCIRDEIKVGEEPVTITSST